MTAVLPVFFFFYIQSWRWYSSNVVTSLMKFVPWKYLSPGLTVCLKSTSYRYCTSTWKSFKTLTHAVETPRCHLPFEKIHLCTISIVKLIMHHITIQNMSQDGTWYQLMRLFLEQIKLIQHWFLCCLFENVLVQHLLFVDCTDTFIRPKCHLCKNAFNNAANRYSTRPNTMVRNSAVFL